MAMLLAGAFLAGLFGSPHCVAMCGPLAASCARTAQGLALWHAGRILTYAMLGAVVGAFGAALPGPAWVPAAIATVSLCWFAFSLAGLLPQPRGVFSPLAHMGQRLAGRPGPLTQFAFGLVNGLLPCGLVYSALSLPIVLAGPLPGAAAMLLFGLGTVPAITAAVSGFHRLAARNLTARRILALLVLLAGLWSIGQRAGWLGSNTNPPAAHQH